MYYVILHYVSVGHSSVQPAILWLHFLLLLVFYSWWLFVIMCVWLFVVVNLLLRICVLCELYVMLHLLLLLPREGLTSLSLYIYIYIYIYILDTPQYGDLTICLPNTISTNTLNFENTPQLQIVCKMVNHYNTSWKRRGTPLIETQCDWGFGWLSSSCCMHFQILSLSNAQGGNGIGGKGS